MNSKRTQRCSKYMHFIKLKIIHKAFESVAPFLYIPVRRGLDRYDTDSPRRETHDLLEEGVCCPRYRGQANQRTRYRPRARIEYFPSLHKETKSQSTQEKGKETLKLRESLTLLPSESTTIFRNGMLLRKLKYSFDCDKSLTQLIVSL